MKYVDEFRDAELVHRALTKLRHSMTQPWSIMEICGGQTHSFMRHGLDSLLPLEVRLVHGPGCPVCVTPLELIDKAISIASLKNVILTREQLDAMAYFQGPLRPCLIEASAVAS